MAENGSSIVSFDGPAKEGHLVHRLGVVQLYNVLYALEIVLILSGTFMLLMALRYRAKSNIHCNAKRIFANADLHFVFLSPVRFVSIALILSWYDQNPPDMIITVFDAADKIRVYCVVVAALTLPTAALERVFATVFVMDYETVIRGYISIVLILATNLLSLMLTWSFMHYGFPTTVAMVTLILSNICGIALFLWGSKKNTARYFSRTSAKPYPVGRSYSLSERFQVTENIRVARLLRNMYIVVWVTQAALIGFAIVPVVSDNDVVDLVTWQVFHIAVAIFMNILGVVNLYPNEKFRSDLSRLHEKCARMGRSTVHDERNNEASLRDVFGKQLIHSAEEQAALYFGQLEQL
ncbi:CRE-SRE-15 protein, partial [Aphelenchoides avenae]